MRVRESRWIRLLTLVLLCAAGAPAARGDPGSLPAGGIWDNVQKFDCRIWAKRFDPFEFEWDFEGVRPLIRCVTTAEADGSAKKGAKVTLTAELLDANGFAISLGTQTARTERDGDVVFEFPIPESHRGRPFTARVSGHYLSWKKATSLTTSCKTE